MSLESLFSLKRDLFNTLEVGDTFSDEGFMSTSLDLERAVMFNRDNDNSWVVKILAPEGTHGIYMEDILESCSSV